MKRNISVEMNTSGHLPDITYDYVQDKKLKKFYGKSFKIENFKNQIIDKRNFSDEKRKILVEVLKDQNKDYQHLKAFNDIGLLLKKKLLHSNNRPSTFSFHWTIVFYLQDNSSNKDL